MNEPACGTLMDRIAQRSSNGHRIEQPDRMRSVGDRRITAHQLMGKRDLIGEMCGRRHEELQIIGELEAGMVLQDGHHRRIESRHIGTAHMKGLQRRQGRPAKWRHGGPITVTATPGIPIGQKIHGGT